MGAIILKMLLPELLALLQAAFKNPASLASEQAVLKEIRDLINGLLPPGV